MRSNQMPNFEMQKSREAGTIAEISPHLSATQYARIEGWVAQTNESKPWVAANESKPQDNRDYKNDDEPGPKSNSKQFREVLAELNDVYNKANTDIHHGPQAASIDFELEQASRSLYGNERDRQFQGWTDLDTNTDKQVKRAEKLFKKANKELDAREKGINTRQEGINTRQERLDIVLGDKQYLDDNGQPIEPLREIVTEYNDQLAKSRDQLAKSREQFTTDQKLHRAGNEQTQIILEARRLDKNASQIHENDELLSKQKGKIEKESKRINKQKTELDKQKTELDEQKTELDKKLGKSRISKLNPKNRFAQKEFGRRVSELNAREAQNRHKASQHDTLVKKLEINKSTNDKDKAKLESRTKKYEETIKHLGYNNTQKTSHNADQV
jgi:hypothetical protein